MPPLTKANCAAFKKVAPTKGIVAKKPVHHLPAPASSAPDSGKVAAEGWADPRDRRSVALQALLETQSRARAALAERHSQERSDFEAACKRERAKLEAREATCVAGPGKREERDQQQCVYCQQAISATGELCGCAGCKTVKCGACDWTSQCDDKEGFCPTCCLARIDKCVGCRRRTKSQRCFKCGVFLLCDSCEREKENDGGRGVCEECYEGMGNLYFTAGYGPFEEGH
eukprot:Tamp_20386.p2 GENE.Tamp_20386~~Tamp_20386.p2  ORF type:complete len:229 (-),score=48.53 Tamp_20386:416-1102(-)